MLKATQQALIESMRDIMQNNRTINEQIMFQLSVRMSGELEARRGVPSRAGTQNLRSSNRYTLSNGGEHDTE